MAGSGWARIESLDAGFDAFVVAVGKGQREAPGIDLMQAFAACQACGAQLGKRFLIGGVPMVLGMLISEMPRRACEQPGSCPACLAALAPEEITHVYTARIPEGYDASFFLHQEREGGEWPVRSLHAFTPPSSWVELGFPLKFGRAVEGLGRVFQPVEPVLMRVVAAPGPDDPRFYPITRESSVALFRASGQAEMDSLAADAIQSGLSPPLHFSLFEAGTVPDGIAEAGAADAFSKAAAAKGVGVAIVYSIPGVLSRAQRWAQLHGCQANLGNDQKVVLQAPGGRYTMDVARLCNEASRRVITFDELWEETAAPTLVRETFEGAMDFVLGRDGKGLRYEIVVTSRRTIFVRLREGMAPLPKWKEVDFNRYAFPEGTVRVTHAEIATVAIGEEQPGQVGYKMTYRDGRSEKAIEGRLELSQSLVKNTRAIGLDVDHVKRVSAGHIQDVYAKILGGQKR